jgi:hypothetical protein
MREWKGATMTGAAELRIGDQTIQLPIALDSRPTVPIGER